MTDEARMADDGCTNDTECVEDEPINGDDINLLSHLDIIDGLAQAHRRYLPSELGNDMADALFSLRMYIEDEMDERTGYREGRPVYSVRIMVEGQTHGG